MVMAGQVGWGPADLRIGSLAMLRAAWFGKAQAEGWLEARVARATAQETADLVEMFGAKT